MGLDLEQPSEELQKDGKDSGQIVSLHTEVATVSTLKNAVNNTQNPSRCLSNSKRVVHDGVLLPQAASSPHENMEPHDGMEFDSKEDAFAFYKEYAKSVGFGTIIKASRRSRISGNFIDAKFVCTRYGSKRESSTPETAELVTNEYGTPSFSVKKKRGRINRSWSKTDCKACMHVKRAQGGRWIIHSFVKEHNHEIFPDQAYSFGGHRKIDLGNNNVDGLHAVQSTTKKMFVTLSRKSGESKKVQNEKNGIIDTRGQHLAIDEGDMQVMLEHFMYMQDQNPNFFYAVDLNPEHRLIRVLWVDAKSRVDYRSFSDVVFVDTTYIKNEYKMPFVPIMGVNHHFQLLLLGCALVADESKSSFTWVMQAWLRAMGGRAPKVMLSDQDIVLKEAVAEVFPDSRHCFCLWHILSKVHEKLGYVMRQHDNFITKFNKCVLKSGMGEQFEKRWWKMVDRFGLRDDLWIQLLYEDRERWAPAYMRDVFLAGMSTTQRPESMNSFFDKCIQRKTRLKDFLDQYKSILQEKYEEEAEADFETWQKQPGLKSPSPFGKQMAAMYTHTIFKKFQVEVLGVVACHPKRENEDGATVTYKVQDFEENQDVFVVRNETTSDVSCSCRLYEYNGFLCRHVMIVLQMSGVHDIPSQYILKRWTKDAKGRKMMGEQVGGVESRIQRYNNLCRRAFKLSDEGSLSQESFDIAFNTLKEALRKCEGINDAIQSVLEPISLIHGCREFEDVNQSNYTSKTNKKNSMSSKGKLQLEPELITLGVHDSLQPMEHSNLRAPARGFSYESPESTQGLDQLYSRGPSLDGYYSTQPFVQGMVPLHVISPSRDDCFSNQQNMQEPALGHMHYRPQNRQSCFDMQRMDQPNEGPKHLHGMSSKQLPSKHLPP